MNLAEYEKQFTDILEGRNQDYPYDAESYVNYVKMNLARIKRWNKTGKLNPELVDVIENIDQPLKWVLITEPWCGDAAHSHAFIEKLVNLNPNISLEIQNRDAPNSEIDQYLTNGGKSIPKLIVRDANGQDLFTWGPRPKEAQEMVMTQREDPSSDPENNRRALQKWYNKNKGKDMQEELLALAKEKTQITQLK